MERSRLSRLWWTYGPSPRWQHFRMYGRVPNGKWMPLTMRQIVGTRDWSISITRIGPVREDR